MEKKPKKLNHLLSRPILAIIVIAVLGAVLYIPSIKGEFVFDDISNIAKNSFIKDLGYFTNIKKAEEFRHARDLNRRYVSYLSFAVNYQLGGLDTTGYHIVNILIHIANALLLYAMVILMFKTPFLRNSNLAGRSPTIALIAALIFVSHPVQTQAVSYVVQRIASLATLFYLSSVTCYLAFRLAEQRKRKLLFYALCTAAAVLGMKTKEIVFTLPLAVLMFELSFFAGPMKKRLFWWLPLALSMLIIPLTIAFSAQDTAQAASGLDDVLRARIISRGEYLVTEFRVLVTYLRLTFFPFNQNLDYSYPTFESFMDFRIWLSCALLLTLAGMGVFLFWKSRKGNAGLRPVALSVGWFFLTLSVESTLIPLMVIYEHRLYLPMAGVSLGAATGAVLLYDALHQRWARRAAQALLIAVLVVLSVATVSRNFVWQSAISMWSDVVTKSPDKSRGHTNLGEAYRKAGMEDKALEQFELSLQVQSAGDHVDFAGRYKTYLNIGSNYLQQGDFEKAIQFFRRSIEINPEYDKGYYHLALAYLNEGQPDRALANLSTAININPGYASAYYLMGNAYMMKTNPAEAAKRFRKALELDPGQGVATLGLAKAYKLMGRSREALNMLRLAARNMSGRPDVQYLLGNALKEAGDLEGAREAWVRTLELDPKHAEALNQLGVYHMIKGDEARAARYFGESLKYQEDNAEAHYNLASALESLGRPQEALTHYERFIQLAPPGYADVVERVRTKVREMKR